MKKFCLAIVILFFSGMTFSFSQDQPSSKVHELGLIFSNLDNFGIRYKTGNEKTLFRLTFVALNISSNQSSGQVQNGPDQKNTGMGAGLNLGFEKRIHLVQNFHLLLGSDLGISYIYNKEVFGSYKATEWSVSPALYFVFGAAYQAGQHFLISAEIAPSLLYKYEKQKTERSGYDDTDITNKNLGFGLSNNSASITIAYRISK
jgi:hypothetical protein